MSDTKTILSFLHTMGLDWSYGHAPRDRFNEDDKAFTIVENVKKSSPSQSLPSSLTPLLTPLTSDTLMPKKKLSSTSPNHPANTCQSLEELRQAMETFEDCPLKHDAKNTVFCDGNPSAKIMLVGEAPGADEDLQGKPFVGMSGQLLDKMMAAIGLDRTCVYISNIIPWRPPGNRPPSTQEIALCLPFIERHIYLKKPEFLLLLGGVATKAILQNNAGIMRLRGQWQSYTPPCAEETFQPIRTLPTFHPAFLLRSPGQKVYAWEDLKTLKTAVDESEIL